MKFLWVMAGDGPLTLEGRRLDGEARPLRSEMSDGFVGRGFQPSYLIFATAGCWEVTAKSNGSALTFVTRVTTEGYGDGRDGAALEQPAVVVDSSQNIAPVILRGDVFT
jgi:hypothetical protein